ncbi:DNA mismatch repair protein Mlh1 [Purpureocillium lavendulum]|uniref:DNA mismatch repair protein Mlh1 n=1 Tax=Purpureocillium lavendulum TaxID=1247861 RepID=A0AB34FZJ9_9HYPO|nr:DNA mismatch repair protein Mlh1 [Purpureocillium lavendulum]
MDALDPDVVNKIAAGEIIVAPVHALKELIENAVDAGSTSIEIVVKDGGLKQLQITDNGGGIQKDDLPILCERHTTSKISAFEDLTTIGTYGFRGEALASISHIAHLSVTTRTKDSDVGWRAHYLDGRLAPAKPGQPAEPKMLASRPGTQITVEDLFFNVPTRRRAFRSHSEEFNKIIDMVGRYAVHCAGVGFTCKKGGEASNTLSIQAQASPTDRIRQIHGSNVANELIEFSTTADRWGYTAHGLVTNANYHIKKTTLLLFINHRAVESSNIKKAVEQVYGNYLPKGGHPFIYLSLEIDPGRVDVNVHPTKREVHFLNEDEIIQDVCSKIEEELASVDTSRTFKTQTLLPGAKLFEDAHPEDADPATPKYMITGKARRNSNELVRTDTSVRKITSMFLRADSGQSGRDGPGAEEPLAVPENVEYEATDREPVLCRLRSVKELRSEVRDDMHHDLTEVFASHTFVGVVDENRRLAAIQSGIKLYLVDYGHTCYEYFYQLGLTDFGNFGTIRFSPPLGLGEILTMAAETEKKMIGASDEDFDVDAIASRVANQLIERREMLLEYFSLEISPAGELISIPLLVKGYTPSIGKLPQFLLRLGPNVDWTDEKACFESFLKELATFYVPEQLPTASNGKGSPAQEEEAPAEVRTRRQHVRWAVENIFFPAFKARLVATKSLMDGGILEVASLKGLYKEAVEVEGGLVGAGPQLGVRLFVDGPGEGANLGDGGLEMGEEAAAPEDVRVVGEGLVAVDVEELVEGLDGVGGGRPVGQAVGGEQGDEQGADLAVAVGGRGVKGELAEDADALDAEALEGIVVAVAIGGGRGGAQALGRLVEGDELAVLAGLEGCAAAEAAGDGPGERGDLRGEADVGRVRGEDGRDDVLPEGAADGRPCLLDAGVLVLGEVDDRHGPCYVVEGREGVALQPHRIVGLENGEVVDVVAAVVVDTRDHVHVGLHLILVHLILVVVVVPFRLVVLCVLVVVPGVGVAHVLVILLGRLASFLLRRRASHGRVEGRADGCERLKRELLLLDWI